MTRSQFVFAAADGVADAVPSCVEDSTTLCARVYELFGLDWLAENAQALNADQWRVGRELRMRLKERFVAEGFRTPLPLLAGSGAATRTG
jgi:hypothetical protein